MMTVALMVEGDTWIAQEDHLPVISQGATTGIGSEAQVELEAMTTEIGMLCEGKATTAAETLHSVRALSMMIEHGILSGTCQLAVATTTEAGLVVEKTIMTVGEMEAREEVEVMTMEGKGALEEALMSVSTMTVGGREDVE